MTNTNLVDCNTGRGINDLSLQPDGTGGFLHDVHRSLGVGNIGWVNEYGNANSLRNHVVQGRSRFASTSPTKKLMPVALPPGRARLATRPSRTGSSPTPKTIGIVVVAALAASAAGVLPGTAINHGHPSVDQVSENCWQAIVLAL